MSAPSLILSGLMGMDTFTVCRVLGRRRINLEPSAGPFLEVRVIDGGHWLWLARLRPERTQLRRWRRVAPFGRGPRVISEDIAPLERHTGEYPGGNSATRLRAAVGGSPMRGSSHDGAQNYDVPEEVGLRPQRPLHFAGRSIDGARSQGGCRLRCQATTKPPSPQRRACLGSPWPPARHSSSQRYGKACVGVAFADRSSTPRFGPIAARRALQ